MVNKWMYIENSMFLPCGQNCLSAHTVKFLDPVKFLGYTYNFTIQLEIKSAKKVGCGYNCRSKFYKNVKSKEERWYF